MIYIISIIILGLLMVMFALKGDLKQVIARSRKDVKVIIDKGSTTEITYAKITLDSILEERGRKKNRFWLISDPEDIKYCINEKMNVAYVTNKAFSLNKDVVLAAKLAWQQSKRVPDLIDDNNKQFKLKIKNDADELIDYYTNEIEIEGTTINSKYVDKVMIAKSASNLKTLIDTRANQIANRQLQNKAMKNFMYGLIGAAIGVGVAYLIIQQGSFDPAMLADLVSQEGAEVVAKNVTNI